MSLEDGSARKREVIEGKGEENLRGPCDRFFNQPRGRASRR